MISGGFFFVRKFVCKRREIIGKFLFQRFDALSHRSSGNSINVSDNMGVVSKTSTPLSGSFENMGVANFGGVADNFKKIQSGRGRGLAGGSQSPLGKFWCKQKSFFFLQIFFKFFSFSVSNSRTLSNTLPRKKSSETYSESPVLDDWEQKLLGKKSVVPYSGKFCMTVA